MNNSDELRDVRSFGRVVTALFGVSLRDLQLALVVAQAIDDGGESSSDSMPTTASSSSATLDAVRQLRRHLQRDASGCISELCDAVFNAQGVVGEPSRERRQCALLLFNWLLDAHDAPWRSLVDDALRAALCAVDDATQRRRCLAAVVAVRARAQLLNDRHTLLVKRIRESSSTTTSSSSSSSSSSAKIVELQRADQRGGASSSDLSALTRVRGDASTLLARTAAAVADVVACGLAPTMRAALRDNDDIDNDDDDDDGVASDATGGTRQRVKRARVEAPPPTKLTLAAFECVFELAALAARLVRGLCFVLFFELI